MTLCVCSPHLSSVSEETKHGKISTNFHNELANPLGFWIKALARGETKSKSEEMKGYSFCLR